MNVHGRRRWREQPPCFDSIRQTTRATANNIFGQVLPQSVLPSISGPVLPSVRADWGQCGRGLFLGEPFDLGLREAAYMKPRAAGTARPRGAFDAPPCRNAAGAAFPAPVNAQQVVVAAEG